MTKITKISKNWIKFGQDNKNIKELNQICPRQQKYQRTESNGFSFKNFDFQFFFYKESKKKLYPVSFFYCRTIKDQIVSVTLIVKVNGLKTNIQALSNPIYSSLSDYILPWTSYVLFWLCFFKWDIFYHLLKCFIKLMRPIKSVRNVFSNFKFE